MRTVLGFALYTALATAANADTSAIADLREGDMRKLRFHSEAQTVPAAKFKAEDGSEMSMDSFKGKVTVLNFWATWCAPCRHEMPQLSQLQTDLGGDDFEVVTVATGRNEPVAMRAFFDEIEVDNLPLHTDARQTFARKMGVLGLPVTVVLDRKGNEIARMQGDADWSSDNAKKILSALIAQ